MFRGNQPNPRAAPQTAQVLTHPLPVLGLNIRDSYENMQPQDAIALINLLSTAYGLRVRKGYRDWATGLPAADAVGTIMSFYPPDAGQSVAQQTSVTITGSLFACTNNNIYDITGGGTGPWTELIGSGEVTSNFWQWRNFQNAGGNALICCNHEGGYYIGRGAGFSSGFSSGFTSSFSFRRIISGPNPENIQNVDPETFAYLMVWKKRLWFVEKNSSRAWYLPPEQLTGSATQFDFGSHFRHGGHLVGLANWTIDGGEGIDDLLVAVSSNGDVVIYKGYDPDSAATDPNAFQLHGVWYAGALPAGRRCIDPYGGDVHILTARGTMPLSQLTQTSTIEQQMNITISSKIDPALTEFMNIYADSEDWYLKILPNEDWTVIGIPEIVGAEGVRQYARVNTTAAWSEIRQLPMKCMTNHDHITFGGHVTGGKVSLLFQDNTDNAQADRTPGDFIAARVIGAYSDLGYPGLFKVMPMVRPKILANQTPIYTIKLLADYEFPGFTASSPPSPTEQALWDRARWDQAKWAGTLSPILSWIGVTGGGYTLTTQIDFQAEGDTRFTGTDYWTKRGGPL